MLTPKPTHKCLHSSLHKGQTGKRPSETSRVASARMDLDVEEEGKRLVCTFNSFWGLRGQNWSLGPAKNREPSKHPPFGDPKELNLYGNK